MEDGDCSMMNSWTIDVDTVHDPLVYSVFSEPSIKWRGAMKYLSALLINRKICHHCRKSFLFVMIGLDLIFTNFTISAVQHQFARLVRILPTIFFWHLHS